MGVADSLVENLAPFIAQGPELEDFLRAIGAMFAQVELYAEDQDDGTPGWAVVFIPDRCPAEALPYAAQFVGERLPLGISELDARQWMRDAPNYQRGTLRSIARAAQRSLTGSRIVAILERTLPDGTEDPDGDNFLVHTYTLQTPDPDQVWADLQDVLPDDMICHYTVLESATWDEIQAGSPTWAHIEGEFPTWDVLAGATPGASIWTR